MSPISLASSSIVLCLTVLSGCASAPASGTTTATTAADASEPITGTTATLIVHGMSCPLCANNVDKQLRSIRGIETVHVNMGTGEATITLAPNARVTKAQLAKAIDGSGFTLTQVRIP
ncbi:MAG: heavy-metal-associated domain-containing protein [Planctomycetota bacterium]|nr:heavy-metal-associated domain-containing protein [Planctomycetota bacterium]